VGEVLKLLPELPDRLLILPARLLPDLSVGLPVLLVLVVGSQPLQFAAVAIIRPYTSLSTMVCSTGSAIGILHGPTAQAACRADRDRPIVQLVESQTNPLCTTSTPKRTPTVDNYFPCASAGIAPS